MSYLSPYDVQGAGRQTMMNSAKSLLQELSTDPVSVSLPRAGTKPGGGHSALWLPRCLAHSRYSVMPLQ